MNGGTVTPNYNTEEGRNTSYCQLMYKKYKIVSKAGASDRWKCKGEKLFMDLKKFVLEGNPVCRKGSCDRGRSFQDYNVDNCLDSF